MGRASGSVVSLLIRAALVLLLIGMEIVHSASLIYFDAS